MQDILNHLGSTLGLLGGQVLSTVEQPLKEVASLLETYVANPIERGLAIILNNIGSAASTAERYVSSGISDAVNGVGNALSIVGTSISRAFNNTVNAVGSALQTVGNAALSTINGIVQGVEQGYGAFASVIHGALTDVGSAIGSALTTVGNELASAYQSTIAPLARFLEGLPSDIISVAKDVVAGVEDVGKFVERIASATEKNIVGPIERFEAWANKQSELGVVGVFAEFLGKEVDKGIAEITGVDPQYLDPRAIARIGVAARIDFVLGLWMEFGPSAAFIVAPMIQELQNAGLAPDYRSIHQAANAGMPNELIGVGELVAARYKGTIAKQTYYDQTRKHGLSDTNADILFATGETLLGLGELVALWYRGKIASRDELYAQALKVRADKYQVDQSIALFERLVATGEQIEFWRRGILPAGWQDYFDDARREGWSEERIAALKAASFRIPTPFEQKRFTIRQVDDPAVVDKYQYDYKLGQAYLDAAKANGYDEATAKRLYRDSWAIPPFFITESLYRSGLLDRETFQQFLEIEGYTPYFADKLISQLAPKLTQGDIKDMYKYQVIAAADIVPKLATIGITGALADELSQLWQASVKLASPLDQTGTQAANGKVKEDTGTLVKTAYKDGILTRDDATAKLKAINYSDDAAALTLDIVDYEKTQEAVKATFTQVKDEYASRSITLNDALNALQKAGATTQQMLTYQAELDKATTVKSRIPTLAEFGSWYKKGIITVGELASGISLLGYADTWIPFFMLADGVALKDIQALGLDVTDVLQSP